MFGVPGRAPPCEGRGSNGSELNANQSEPHIRHPFVTYSDAQGPAAALDAVRDQTRSPRTVAVGDTMRADALLLLQSTWPEASFLPASTVLAPIRMRKSAEEVEALRSAARAADVAVEAAYAASGPGATEERVALAGFHFHWLRHGYASLMAAWGILGEFSVYVAGQVGHYDANTTKRSS